MKKRIKQLIATLCLLSMVMTLSITAFAEGDTAEEPGVSAFWSADVPASLKQEKFSEYSSSNYTKYTKTKEGEEKPFAELEIKISKENSLTWRKGLVSDKIDLKEFAEGKLDKATVGGREFALVKTDNFGKEKAVYYGRDAASQMSIKLTVNGVLDDPDINKVLNTLKFMLPEGDSKEAPWPWEGKPLVTKTTSQDAGGHTLKATQIIGDESLLAPNVFDNRVAVVDDLVYLLSQNLLYVYKMDGDKMQIQDKMELDRNYTTMSCDKKGQVYVSGGGKTKIYKDGKLLKEMSISKKLLASPDGAFLMEYFVNKDDLKMVDPETEKETDFTITGVDKDYKSVSEVSIDGDCIFLCGSNNSIHNIQVTDTNGTVLHTLLNEEDKSLGSITRAACTTDGFMGIDGNMRKIVLWDKNGKWLSATDVKELFGASYPWVSGLCKTDEKTYYICMSQERDDHSWDEVVLYRLTME